MDAHVVISIRRAGCHQTQVDSCTAWRADPVKQIKTFHKPFFFFESDLEIVFVLVRSPAAVMHLNYIVTVSIISLIRACNANFWSQSSKMATRWLLLQRRQKKHNVMVLSTAKTRLNEQKTSVWTVLWSFLPTGSFIFTKSSSFTTTERCYCCVFMN